MNERIKELIKQATEVRQPAPHSNQTENSIVFNKEKFAELIVKECLGIVSDVGSRKWMGFKGTDTDQCLFRIRQQFGVK